MTTKAVFDFDIQESTSASIDYPVRIVKFGDGYEQRQPKSLRPSETKWDCRILDKKPELEKVWAFFQARKGVESFYWEAPFGGRKLVRAEQVKLKHLGFDVWEMTFQLVEVVA